MATQVHPLADISSKAELGDGVSIGAFSHIGPGVVIGDGTAVANNVSISGRTRIGCRNEIFPGVVIGQAPQDISYQGSDTQVLIGDENIIRECVTINRASEKEEGVTEVGDGCFFMACSHVAHDCRVSNRVILANGTLLGGHVHVHDDVTISGNVAVHHFVTIGGYAFIGGMSRVVQDVPPYVISEGNPARPRCVNMVGLKRNDFPREVIRALTETHRLLYRGKVGVDRAREELRSREMLIPAVNHMLSFVQDQHEGRNGRGRESRRAA